MMAEADVVGNDANSSPSAKEGPAGMYEMIVAQLSADGFHDAASAVTSQVFAGKVDNTLTARDRKCFCPYFNKSDISNVPPNSIYLQVRDLSESLSLETRRMIGGKVRSLY